MQLHSHVVLLVQAAQGQQHVGGVLVALFLGQGLTGHGLLESSGSLLSVGIHVGDVIQAVVRGAAAHLYEELQALIQSVDNAVGTGKLAADHVL